MSLELGWMAPKQAARYVEACRQAGLLVAEGEMLRLAFDARAVEVPRGLRPDPDDLPTAAPEEDGFSTWLAKVSSARGEDAAATLAAVEALQAEAAGRLHAEAALLVLAQRSGLDVQAAAAAALSRLQA